MSLLYLILFTMGGLCLSTSWTDELLDEIELNKELLLSLEEEDTISLEEWEQRVKEKAANGYYRQRTNKIHKNSRYLAHKPGNGI